MPRPFLFCLLILCGPIYGHAEEIHKCVTAEGIVYQGVPCKDGEASTAQMSTALAQTRGAPALRANPARGDATPECGVRPRGALWIPGRKATLCIGMRDDEVLNLPGWGRPAKIARTRGPREWRETWSYRERATGSPQLLFVNGQLAQVDTESLEVRPDSIAPLASN